MGYFTGLSEEFWHCPAHYYCTLIVHGHIQGRSGLLNKFTESMVLSIVRLGFSWEQLRTCCSFYKVPVLCQNELSECSKVFPQPTLVCCLFWGLSQMESCGKIKHPTWRKWQIRLTRSVLCRRGTSGHRMNKCAYTNKFSFYFEIVKFQKSVLALESYTVLVVVVLVSDWLYDWWELLMSKCQKFQNIQQLVQL